MGHHTSGSAGSAGSAGGGGGGIIPVQKALHTVLKDAANGGNVIRTHSVGNKHSASVGKIRY
jgi:hypothetical protein